MKLVSALSASLVLTLAAAQAIADTSILFIGNSFTYGWGSSTRYYRADSVTDLNHEGIGGVPALFKSFADQAGLDYDIHLQTRGGAGLDFHLAEKLGVMGRRPWDQVVMHGYSTLDANNPGDPTVLINTVAEMSEFFHSLNSDVEVYLTATWSVPTWFISMIGPGLELQFIKWPWMFAPVMTKQLLRQRLSL